MLRAVCTRAQVQRLKESRLTIRGDGDKDPVASEERHKRIWIWYINRNKCAANVHLNGIIPIGWRLSFVGVFVVLYWSKICYGTYCGWHYFRWVPIFVVFVEGLIHKIQYPRISDFLYELWRNILRQRISNSTNVSFLFHPRKLVPTKIKASTVYFKADWK